MTDQKRCPYLCGPHLDRCAQQTNEHGGAHKGDCHCKKCVRIISRRQGPCFYCGNVCNHRPGTAVVACGPCLQGIADAKIGDF